MITLIYNYTKLEKKPLNSYIILTTHKNTKIMYIDRYLYSSRYQDVYMVYIYRDFYSKFDISFNEPTYLYGNIFLVYLYIIHMQYTLYKWMNQ